MKYETQHLRGVGFRELNPTYKSRCDLTLVPYSVTQAICSMTTCAKFYFGSAIAIIASLGIAVAAKADTVQARCDVYPKGEDRAKSSGLCTFSQRQGVVGIQLQNGKRYDLVPVGNNPGNYRDQNGKAAYRQSGLGDKGQIFRLATESIYVYWDAAPYTQQNSQQNPQPAPNTTAKSPTPLTYMTVRNSDEIMTQITEGEFKFRGLLRRTSGQQVFR
ncbi:hypothetical protein K9N68_32730 [Kovacikia minuta CCNUW1]|uniref:hypothetical protein n=1 Tax=Kovacikia minuta TaxID=2931930 RepID=UPI001CCD7858|nr:hypothetical protein [Kovacikia minuta]UBF26221.1 hypothetical protein K9N68_32730 [Kovacikia minuta CCNUW1]